MAKAFIEVCTDGSSPVGIKPWKLSGWDSGKYLFTVITPIIRETAAQFIVQVL